jgi:hypothetical protein
VTRKPLGFQASFRAPRSERKDVRHIRPDQPCGGHGGLSCGHRTPGRRQERLLGPVRVVLLLCTQYGVRTLKSDGSFHSLVLSVPGVANFLARTEHRGESPDGACRMAAGPAPDLESEAVSELSAAPVCLIGRQPWKVTLSRPIGIIFCCCILTANASSQANLVFVGLRASGWSGSSSFLAFQTMRRQRPSSGQLRHLRSIAKHQTINCPGKLRVWNSHCS